ncbi:MAG: hypothetical protein AB8F94_23050 [Saprospiraceae bacterium]
MKKKKHILAIISFFIVSTVSIAHAFVFPQETRCLLVDFYDFEKEGNLYFRENIDLETKIQLQNLISQAETRVGEFWEEKITNPKFIYCETDADYLKFGAPFMTPAAAVLKFGSYVVISKDGIDLDILAHEISHTELYSRIGFFNHLTNIPVWFSEGLAMQVDDRSYYSTDSLEVKSNHFQNLPEVKKMVSFNQFGFGSREEVQLNYATAKYEVGKWFSKEKIKIFVKKINAGSSFEEALGE